VVTLVVPLKRPVPIVMVAAPAVGGVVAAVVAAAVGAVVAVSVGGVVAVGLLPADEPPQAARPNSPSRTAQDAKTARRPRMRAGTSIGNSSSVIRDTARTNRTVAARVTSRIDESGCAEL